MPKQRKSDERTRLGQGGFAAGGTYAAGRPGYCREALDFLMTGLALSSGSTVLDLGAGTGKFTEHLVELVSNVVAVEPSASMRAQFHQLLPDVTVLDGTGEQIPLDDASVDAVIVAQAFHWFDAPRALREIHRVLAPGGGLGLVWNERDESVPWVHELSVAMQWTTRQPYRVGTDFRPVVLADHNFHSARREKFPFTDAMDHERLRQRVLSTSYIAAADETERAAIMRSVDEVIGRLPDVVQMPYVADTYVFGVQHDER